MVLRDNFPKLRNHAPFCLPTAQETKTRRFSPTLLKLLFLRRQDESAHFPPTTACGWIRRTNEADETTGKEPRWQILVWKGKRNSLGGSSFANGWLANPDTENVCCACWRIDPCKADNTRRPSSSGSYTKTHHREVVDFSNVLTRPF